jgi:protein TonB
MFSTLESNWDQSARRGRATLASFTIQTFAVSLLLAISVLWVERPPQVHWLQISAPTTFTPTAPEPTPIEHPHFRAGTVSNMLHGQIIAPPAVPLHAAFIDDSKLGPPAPNLPNIDFGPGRGSRDVPYGLGNNIPVVIPARPAATKPLPVSDLGEGSLIYRVQPVYPPLARQARIQGSVELRAIISKTGAIENLAVVSGHPMLVKAALEAVRQWRYRPYLLNHEPIEVETDITVNFLLSGG